MRLIVGGKGQGKKAYAAKTYGLKEEDFALSFEQAKSLPALYGAHTLISRCLKEGLEPEGLFEELIKVNPDIIIICDELGCGVVPIDPFDREWRERTGRICCALAAKAESVERVLCGLGLKLK